MSLRIGIVVGEASGDILGSGLMAELQKRYPDAVFEGIGGPKMLARGFTSFYPQDRLAVMGLIEPLKRLFELLRIRKHLIKHFTQNPPDLFIGIDSPDFNLTIEQQLKKAGIPTVHYVSPSVWAWRQKRIVKIARSVDLMLTLLPFEAEFYQQHNVPVCFVGHPLADEIPLHSERARARQELQISPDSTCIALMPGSRGGEVKMLGPIFWQTAKYCVERYPTIEFLVPTANAARRLQIEQQLQDAGSLPLTIIDGQSQTVMTAADAVLMASGTTSLEAMLLKRPMVVAYKFSKLSYWILSRLVKSRFFSLPNLLADEPLVAELLQDDVNPERLGNELMSFIEEPEKTHLLEQKFTEIHQRIRCNASEKAASAVLQLIGRG